MTLRHSFPVYGLFGIATVVLSEVGLLFGVDIIGVYFTPLVWTGYILFLDGVQWYLHGHSLIQSRTKEFLWMLPWSFLCWLIFEAYNLHLQNWKYIGLPSDSFSQMVGFVWSFATIFPAILLTAEFFQKKFFVHRVHFPFHPSRLMLSLCSAAGAALLLFPLMMPQEAAAKLFGLVWVGFILLLDPINYTRRRNSIIGQLSQGELGTLISLLFSGLCCGLLWEFWNYGATAKWHYTIPLEIAGPKLFEMPLLGYMGFLPFAVECYVMNEFFYVLFPRLQERIS